MRIHEIKSQHRRDFYAIYECEHCGSKTEKRPGYDDSYFHDQVIPKMKCEHCGRTADETYEPLAPKYPDGVTI